MNIEEIEKQLKECFKNAERNEKSGIKHKGLLLRKPEDKEFIEILRKKEDITNFYLCLINKNIPTAPREVISPIQKLNSGTIGGFCGSSKNNVIV